MSYIRFKRNLWCTRQHCSLYLLARGPCPDAQMRWRQSNPSKNEKCVSLAPRPSQTADAWCRVPTHMSALPAANSPQTAEPAGKPTGPKDCKEVQRRVYKCLTEGQFQAILNNQKFDKAVCKKLFDEYKACKKQTS